MKFVQVNLKCQFMGLVLNLLCSLIRNFAARMAANTIREIKVFFVHSTPKFLLKLSAVIDANVHFVKGNQY